MNLKKILLIPIFTISTLFSFNPTSSMQEPKLKINNTVLLTLNEKTISVMDIAKTLENSFKASFPDLVNSDQARYQFYTSGWQKILSDIVNKELILEDAKSKELKIADNEVREEIEKKYGPNVISNLEKNNLSFDEAFKIVKDDMIMQRMMWYYVQSKALLSITPQVIRGAYRLYLEQNPKEDIFSYQIITIKTKENIDLKAFSEDIYSFAAESNKDLSLIEDEILKKQTDNIKIQISKLYTVKDKELVSNRKSILSSLDKNSYSKPTLQNDNKEKSYKIFYLKNLEKKLPPTFDEMAPKLKDELTSKAVYEESEKYFKKLRKQYGVDEHFLLVPKDYQPFTLN